MSHYCLEKPKTSPLTAQRLASWLPFLALVALMTFFSAALATSHEPEEPASGACPILMYDLNAAMETTSYGLPHLLKTPLREQGDFRYTLDDVIAYYSAHPMTESLFTLEDPPESMHSLNYKINDRGEFQFANWHEEASEILDFQAAWKFEISDFVSQFEGEDLVEAKINFFRPLHFHQTEYYYERPFAYMREWGELPHPPIQNLKTEDIEVVNKRFKKGGPDKKEIATSPMNSPGFHHQLDEVSQSELTIGNDLKILMDSDSTVEKKALIKKAKKSVFVSSLVFVNDPATMEIVDLLIDKAREGLDVRVLAEASLSWLHGSALKKLRENGVQVVYANDFFRYNSSVVYHTKIIAVDNTKVIMGGQNMLDADLTARGTDFKNRDADIYVKGPGATDIIWNFMRDWNHFTSRLRGRRFARPFADAELADINQIKALERELGQRGSEHYETWFSDPTNLPRGMGRFIGQSPYNNINTISDAHVMYLEATKRYFVMTNPHIFDTHTEDKPRGFRISHKRYRNLNRLFNAMRAKLKDTGDYEMDILTTGGDFATNEATPMAEILSKRWLDKGKVLPSNLLFMLLRWGNKKLFKLTYSLIQRDWLTHSNARVWSHQSYLHSKIWYFDGIATSIGSLNFHFNATDHSYEATFITHDPAIVRSAEQVLATDFANSIPFTK